MITILLYSTICLLLYSRKYYHFLLLIVSISYFIDRKLTIYTKKSTPQTHKLCCITLLFLPFDVWNTKHYTIIANLEYQYVIYFPLFPRSLSLSWLHSTLTVVVVDIRVLWTV
jgi:hypothetical protein